MDTSLQRRDPETTSDHYKKKKDEAIKVRLISANGAKLKSIRLEGPMREMFNGSFASKREAELP